MDFPIFKHFLVAMIFISFSFTILIPSSAQGAQTPEIPGELTANVGFVSDYVFRGTLENDDGAVQGGVDYEHPTGLYVGYWGSTLGDDAYSAESGSFENDLYAGFSRDIGSFSFDLGFLQYVYQNTATGNDSNEVYGSVGYGPFEGGLTVTTQDANWTNAGDVFATLSASRTFFGDLSGEALVRFSELEDGGPARSGVSDPDDGFSQFEVGLSHPIGETGADMMVRYVLNDSDNGPGGSDNHFILGVNYGFDIAK